MKFLTRKGFLIEEKGMTYLTDTDPDLALGPRAGQKVLSLQTVPTQGPPPIPGCCVSEHGFSLHAEVCCAAHQRKKLEHLCRYITRPAIANERLANNVMGTDHEKVRKRSRQHGIHSHVTAASREVAL